MGPRATIITTETGSPLPPCAIHDSATLAHGSSIPPKPSSSKEATNKEDHLMGQGLLSGTAGLRRSTHQGGPAHLDGSVSSLLGTARELAV